MAHIDSITETAAVLYRRGVPLKEAVMASLDHYGEQDPFERTALLKQVCSRLGKRGNKKKAAMKGRAVRKPKQSAFRFSPTHEG